MIQASGSGVPAGFEGLARRWGWFVALGVALGVVGVLASFEAAAVTVASVILIGAAMLVGGVAQLASALATRGWEGFVPHLATGLLYAVGGFLVMSEPLAGSFVITLVLAAVLLVAGVARIVVALRHRGVAAWLPLLASGVVTVLVGLGLYLTLPWSGLWVLGTLVAVELIVHGIGWIAFGLALRRGATG